MLSIAVVGRAMADCGIKHKSGVKQIDRLLSSDGLNVDGLERTWLRYVVDGLPEVVVAMDWTDFDDDDHTTLCVYLVTRPGRALSLPRRTTTKKSLPRGQRIATKCLPNVLGWAGFRWGRRFGVIERTTVGQVARCARGSRTTDGTDASSAAAQ
jgi:hypothetical protein